MPLQDLTPQLRTRLSRMERAVGWFVFFATVLLVCGFGYYIYHLADQRGWFKIKAKFHTYVSSSAGLNIGDPVYVMGFSVGRITDIHPMPPGDRRGVYLQFEMVEPYFRYVWTEGSYVKIAAAGLLNQRQLEVTRGTNGYEVCVTQPITTFTNLDDLKQLVDEQPGQWQLSQEIFDNNSNLLYRAYTWLNDSNLQQIAELHLPFVRAYNNQEADKHYIAASWHRKDHSYETFTENDDTTWLPVLETPPVADQLQAMINQVKDALPGVIAMTNQLGRVLNNAAMATSNLNAAVADARPMIQNFADVSSQLREPGGPVNWALGTNSAAQVQSVLTNANSLIINLNTNVTATLFNLADITGTLNAEVQSNTNMLSWLQRTIFNANDFVQGLKHYWLLRSAFKSENEAEAKAAAEQKAREKAAQTNAPPNSVK
jgi:ABC-type transporter Mla subunit MlaD